MEEPVYSFGYWVLRQRKALDLTRAELAARVQCSLETIKKIERDERKPSPQVAELLAEALGLAPDVRETFLEVARGRYAVDRLPVQTQVLPLPMRAIRGYELGHQIGQGSFGAVYRAWQPVVEREVAIKVILPKYANQPDFIRRFEAEARLVARLEHPHITPLYDFWRGPEGTFLVMRWMRGGNLRTVLEKGPVELDQAVEWFAQVSSALSAAHQKGIVHGDLKPENLLIDEDGNIYLSDFGIARQAGSGRPDPGTAYSLSPGYSSPEHLHHEPLTPRSDLYCLGVLLYEMLAGRLPFSDGEGLPQQEQTGPSRLQAVREDLPPGLDEFLQRALDRDPAGRFPDAARMAAALQEAAAGRVRPFPPPGHFQVVSNPYKGLRAFEEADADHFFGREAFVRQMLDRLGGAQADDGKIQDNLGRGRFLAVVGPSGSGKSSVVKAGLLPAVRKGRLPGSEKWFTVEMSPSSQPLEELEAALLRVAANPPASLLGQISQGERGILRAIKRILPADPGVELLLVIDQFEELFTHVEDPALRQCFLEGLFAAVTAEDSRLRVVLTLRADFYDRPLMHPSFGELVRLHTEVVLPLNSAELDEAIRGPAERVGVVFEEGLAAAIAADVSAQPGGLPLMQYALTELFEHRRNGILTQEAYQETGGVLGALSRRAEEVFSSLSSSGQDVARQLFLRLITLGEGVEDTRRRVRVSELEGLVSGAAGLDEQENEKPGSEAGAILEVFGKARLLSFDRDRHSRSPTVEIAHEALLREWRRLKSWLDEARGDVRMQRALGSAAAEWGSAGQDPSFLLHGNRLVQFESWAGATSLALNVVEREFLEISLHVRELQVAAEGMRQTREAALIRRSRRFLRALALVLLLGLLASLALLGSARRSQALAQNEAQARSTQQALAEAREEARATQQALAEGREEARATQQALAEGREEARATAEAFALAQEQDARQQASLAFARELALSSSFVLPSDPELAVMLALQSLDRTYTAAGEEALRTALHSSRVRYSIQGQARFTNPAYSPDGRSIATMNVDGLLQIWDALNGEEQFSRQLGKPGEYVAYSPDGGRLAAGFFDGSILILDARSGEPLLPPLTGHTSWFNEIAFSPDGKFLASANGDNTIRLWDALNGDLLHTLDAPTGGCWPCSSLAFIPGRNHLLISDIQANARLVDLESGEIINSLPAGLNIGPFRSSHSISPDGSWLAAPSSRVVGTVDIWDLPALLEGRSERPLFSLEGQNTILTIDVYQSWLSFRPAC